MRSRLTLYPEQVNQTVRKRICVKLYNDCAITYSGLDVTTPEPLPSDHPLFSLPNCVISPHIAGDDDATREELKKIGLLNLMNGLTGKPLIYQVNLEVKIE